MKAARSTPSEWNLGDVAKPSDRASAPGLWCRCSEAAGRKLWPLDRDQLRAAVSRQTGLNGFRDSAIESRLSLLTRSIDHEANLHPFGRFLARIHLRDLLTTRLLLEETWRTSCAGFDKEPIGPPIFITGMPRSGSTYLHELLAQDPNSRAPLVWEVMSPLPTSARWRIWRAAASLWWFRQFAPKADSVHPIRAGTPQECVAIHSYTLLSRAFAAIFWIPAYEAFLDTVHLDPAYAWEKLFLQFLQWRGPRKRWVLKAPDHVFHLEALLRVFPDAVIIQTHRDPLEVLKSSTRLTEVLQGVFARPRERSEIALREARLLAAGVDRITQFRESHPEMADRFLDVTYAELISNPLATIRRLYRQLDIPLVAPALEAIQKLASNRSRYARHRSESTVAEPGFDSGTETKCFAEYGTRFNV